MSIDFSCKISGEAGQGLQTVGFLLCKCFSRAGFYVFASHALESRIRGGHNYFLIRVSDRKVEALTDKVDILIAFDEESCRHLSELSHDAVVIYDSSVVKLDLKGITALDIPLKETAREKSGNPLLGNSVALGATLGSLEFNFDILAPIFQDVFGDKEAQIIEDNKKAAKAGYDFAYKKLPQNNLAKLPQANANPKLLLSGSEAIALGALKAGCKFMSAYPMSPSTGIITYLANKTKEYNLIAEQAEDEISAVNMALGASYAGVRAMTATSGGGFALMVEGLSLAGMTETPIVMVDCQRPGPATGLPTRTEQGDLEYMIYCGHGEFSRKVFAPKTIEDAFYLAFRAFDLAEEFQIPVIIISDQHIQDSYMSFDKLELKGLNVKRYILFPEEASKIKDYKRYQFTPDGISPRAIPGGKGYFVVVDSDEHDEAGHITEDVDFIRPEMVRKRLKRMDALTRETSEPEKYGSDNPEVLFIGWGSTYGALKEAVDILNRQNEKVMLLQFNELWPFAAGNWINLLENVNYSFVIENNANGQLARVIKSITGKSAKYKINKFNGMPFTAQEIIREFRKIKSSEKAY